MRFVLTALAVIAALVLMVVSAGLNYQFMASLARTPDEARIIGAAAVAGDVLKCCLPFFLFLAWRERRFVFVAVGLPVFLLLSVLSFVAALGNAADMRGGTAHVRDTRSLALRAAEEALERLNATDPSPVPPRAPAEIEAELSILRQDRRWVSSQECRQATVEASRSFCAEYFRVLATHAARMEADRRSVEEARLKSEIVALRERGAGEDAEPQVQILSGLSGRDKGYVRTALIVLSALFIELGSGLGLYLALHHSTRRPVHHGAPDEARTPVRSVRRTKPSEAQNVEHYAVARLVPARGRTMTVGQLYEDYAAWSRGHEQPVLSHRAFEHVFGELADDLGVARSGTVFHDVCVGPTGGVLRPPEPLRALT